MALHSAVTQSVVGLFNLHIELLKPCLFLEVSFVSLLGNNLDLCKLWSHQKLVEAAHSSKEPELELFDYVLFSLGKLKSVALREV